MGVTRQGPLARGDSWSRLGDSNSRPTHYERNQGTRGTAAYCLLGVATRSDAAYRLSPSPSSSAGVADYLRTKSARRPIRSGRGDVLCVHVA